MKKNIVRIAVCGLLATVFAVAPTPARAQESKDAPAAEKKAPPAGEKKKATPPINGKLAAVDKVAKTITIGQTTIQITSETRIEKGGKPATLDDGVVGEPAMAQIKKSDDGKTVAVRVRFGPRGEKGEGAKEKKKE